MTSLAFIWKYPKLLVEFLEKPLLGVSVVYTAAVWAEKLHGPFTKCEMSILCYLGFAQL